ncbi:MAG: adenylate/guanylate cyclase domain-containing protein [Candidatus Binatia bacterium]
MNILERRELPVGRCHDPAGPKSERVTLLAEVQPFVPGLVAHSLAQPGLPIQKELAVLFVDIADSTRTIVRQPLEAALVIIQRFMRLVTDSALAHCGDVKDYEGDGAMLYFRSVEQAASAALTIRAALAAAAEKENFPLQARLSINVGDVIIGEIGTPMRRSVTLIGPMVHVAARLLKHISPGGVIAPQAVVERLRDEAPTMARQFQVLGPCLVLRGFEEECITAYHVPPSGLTEQDHAARPVTEASLICNNSVVSS